LTENENLKFSSLTETEFDRKLYSINDHLFDRFVFGNWSSDQKKIRPKDHLTESVFKGSFDRKG
jgi:hypothetical protein